MATRNLFRFVSVRPPTAAEARRACRLVDGDSATEFVKAVRERQREHEESLERARRAVSVALIESDDYFTRSDAWKDLRPLRRRFQKLIARACRPDGEPDEAPEGGTVEREGEDATGEGEDAAGEGETFAEQVRDWVVDDLDSFAEAKSVLWRSYYANVLVPDLRPNDRGEMVDWIRILDAVERLDPGSGDPAWRYDKRACACVERLERARVHIPQELFAEKPPPDSPPDRPQDDTEDYKRSYQHRLERLQAARSAVDDLYRRKVSALRLADLNEPRRPEREEPARERPEAEDAPGSGGQPARARQAPWLLTDQDADAHAELAAELERLGVPMPGALVSEVTDALDQAIAADTTALVELESRVDLLGIGTAMTVARGTRRGFQPGPRDGDRANQRPGVDAVDAEPGEDENR